MSWIVFENFLPNIDEHIRLISALSQERTVFFVRKEWLDFEELGEIEKTEIMEENYETFRAGLLKFHNENIKRRLETRICEIAKEIQDLQINTVATNICGILTELEKEEYVEYLAQVKKIVMDGVLEDSREHRSLLHAGNYAFTTNNNESHKYYDSNGELEDESKFFKWYKLNNLEEVRSFIEKNQFNYNIIITQMETSKIQYEYYINYYEGEEYILAVKDYKGNFCDIFTEAFK